MRINIIIILRLLLFIVYGMVLCIPPHGAKAGATVKADGTITSIEGEKELRSVTIDGNGYLVSPSVRVINAEGKSVPLERIGLPARVYFRYEYTSIGPVIKSIRVYPKVIPE